MHFLFYTQPDDTHAASVKLALETLGHHVNLWFTADQPTQLYHSVWMDPSKPVWHRRSLQYTDTRHHFDVIWYRRPRKPIVPQSAVHPEDYQFVTRENQQFLEGLTALLTTQSWWVNLPHASKRANAKLLQLYLAKACGLKIPDTLCSNDPNMIRAFIARREGSIYKPFCSSYWKEGEHIRAIYTAKVSEESLPANESLCLTPGIFQAYVNKQYELRITCFGKHCVAVKIEPKHQTTDYVDWRRLSHDDIKLSFVTLPVEVERKIHTLFRRLGIVFGCVDMIVTPEEEYIFLEVNEAGQFLWIEEMLPELQLLDRFVQFLQNRTFYFDWSYRTAHFHLQDYLPMTQKLVSQQFEKHLRGEERP